MPVRPLVPEPPVTDPPPVREPALIVFIGENDMSNATLVAELAATFSKSYCLLTAAMTPEDFPDALQAHHGLLFLHSSDSLCEYAALGWPSVVVWLRPETPPVQVHIFPKRLLAGDSDTPAVVRLHEAIQALVR